MGIYADLLDTFESDDDKKNRVITSGTTRVTRGTGLVAVVFVGLILVFQGATDSVPVLGKLSPGQMLSLVTAAGFVWAIVSAADILGRALATARNPEPAAPGGVTVTRDGAVSDAQRLVLHGIGKPEHAMAIKVLPDGNGSWKVERIEEWDG